MTSRIQDYGAFNVQKKKLVSSEYSFTSEIGFLDINITNRPPELSDIDDIRCEVEYDASIDRKKSGIEDIRFNVKLIELEIKVDDYPNEPKEFEFDVFTGGNIDQNSVIIKKMEKLIPTSPTMLNIDMRKSMNVSDFKIEVYFGND